VIGRKKKLAPPADGSWNNNRPCGIWSRACCVILSLSLYSPPRDKRIGNTIRQSDLLYCSILATEQERMRREKGRIRHHQQCEGDCPRSCCLRTEGQDMNQTAVAPLFSWSGRIIIIINRRKSSRYARYARWRRVRPWVLLSSLPPLVLFEPKSAIRRRNGPVSSRCKCSGRPIYIITPFRTVQSDVAGWSCRCRRDNGSSGSAESINSQAIPKNHATPPKSFLHVSQIKGPAPNEIDARS
jgi:hypothetical protein